MKTFSNLIREVLSPGLCLQCEGCVQFCEAINFGALETGGDGVPRYRDPEKCIECGVCYMICPVTGKLGDEVKRKVSWNPPMGNVIEASIARSTDQDLREKATDGGVLTALLLHLFDNKHIDGAIVTRQLGLFNRRPCLATTREEIVEAAGSYFTPSRGMDLYSENYSTFSSSLSALGPVFKEGLRSVAFIGSPCQIMTVRKMQALGVVPTNSIHCYLGLFCCGSFVFTNKERKKLEKIGGFSWEDVRKINIREHLLIHLREGRILKVALEDLDFLRRHACWYCSDYTAEYADISFGGVGSGTGWTTVVTRTPIGRAIYAYAKDAVLEEFEFEDDREVSEEVVNKLAEHSRIKKERASQCLRSLEAKSQAMEA